MNINIISVGRVREKYIRHGIDEFLRRIAPYSSIKITEIPAEELNQPIKKALQKEAEKIPRHLKNSTYTIILDRKGKRLSSISFADKIREVSRQGVNQVAFVIGSSEGLAEEVKNKGDFILSMSDMTFPHQLMQLILLEQIYRAFRILNNEPYHK